MIVTRFAPSPTGFLHIGGARTALFCYLYTRHMGGKYLLRVEDTDQERSTSAAIDAIKEGLAWMGLTPDGEPVFQSHRFARHVEVAQQLLQAGKAYKCYCSKEELDNMREAQRQAQIKPRYDGRCRQRQEQPDLPFVIRFHTPAEGEVVWDDQIQGTIRIQNKELDDLILVRSDGVPTYNLAVVADDHDMGITHVIRGEDHISNTPRQIHLFRALGWPVPEYAHMPLLHGTDGAKLSKRHGAVSVLQYREDGFLAEAVNNYLVRLGWSHGEQEVFTMEEMIQHFDVKDVGRSAAIFNQSKLLWLNNQHMKSLPVERVAAELLYQLRRLEVVQEVEETLLHALVLGYRERTRTLLEMATMVSHFFRESAEPYEEAAANKHFKGEIAPAFGQLVAGLQGVEDWQAASIEAVFRQVLAESGLAMVKLAQPVRVALTGRDISPGIFEVLYWLGKDRSLLRLQRGLEIIQQKAALLANS
ncbi:MAG: glutamate--tRNA ligase [Magnetococcales bacterium]|nr:glutamate--tRNA ligase [Magnetococcales bacterium]NGZ28247.1 glutamate--tRNA ligase [Magnetococcales bacterium]